MRVARSSSLHLATWNHMRLAVDCMQGALYDWCSGVIPIMRKQLSDCKRGRRKNFGYSSILVAFFFERVSGLSPAVPLLVRSPRYPRLSRWGDIFLRQGGGGSMQSVYDDDFYFGGSDSCQLWSSFHMLEYPKFFLLTLLQSKSYFLIIGITPEHQSYRDPYIQSTASLI